MHDAASPRAQQQGAEEFLFPHLKNLSEPHFEKAKAFSQDQGLVFPSDFANLGPEDMRSALKQEVPLCVRNALLSLVEKFGKKAAEVR